MKYHFKYFPDERGGFYAECIELEGCRTEADTLEELKKNIQDILNLYLDEKPKSKSLFPPPTKKEIKGRNIIAVNPDPDILLAQTLRMLRLQKKLTIEEVAKRMGYKNIWGYQKYESHKASPTFKTLVKLKKIYPKLDLNQIAEN
jgi:antitoxin HicB